MRQSVKLEREAFELLVNALKDHEKRLDAISYRLEVIVKNLKDLEKKSENKLS